MRRGNTHVRLDGIDQFSIGRAVTFVEHSGESFLKGITGISHVDEDQGSNHNLGNDQNHQEEAILRNKEIDNELGFKRMPKRSTAYGRGHAVRFPNGTAASEEGNHEYDRSEHDEQDRWCHDVVFIADVLQFRDFGQ